MEHDSRGILSFGVEGRHLARLVEIGKAAKQDVFEITDEPDLVALPAEIILVNSDKLSASGYNLLSEYYTDAGDDAEELVVWFGTRPFRGRARTQRVCPDIETALQTIETALQN